MCKGQDLDDPHPEDYFLTLVRKASDILRVSGSGRPEARIPGVLPYNLQGRLCFPGT